MKTMLILFFASQLLLIDSISADSGLTAFCNKPSIAFKAIEELHLRNWSAVSIDKIEAKWPTTLAKTNDCDSPDQSDCLALSDLGKDKEFCCCGVSFYFAAADGAPVLTSFVLNIANHDQEQLKSLAKKFTDSLAPVENAVYVDPWQMPGAHVIYPEGSVMTAFSFVSPSTDKIKVTIALLPLEAESGVTWWLRLTMANEP